MTTAYLAGMYAALCDEKSTGPLQGPVQLLEPRVDLLIQEPDTFFEQGLLICGQHGNDPASKRRPVANGDELRQTSPPHQDTWWRNLKVRDSRQGLSDITFCEGGNVLPFVLPSMAATSHMWLWGT